jgi:predicted dehydrogenase
LAVAKAARVMQPLRVAIVGFGFIAEKGHLPAYLASMRNGGAFKLVAVADVCAARRALVRRLVPEARVYPDHEALFANEVGRIHVVDIATPPSEHATVASAAIERDLDVLCENPLTTSAEDARDLVDRARTRGRVVYPCHDHAHAPIVRSVRRVIDSGSIGDVRLVTLQAFRPSHDRGVSEWLPDWRRMRAVSGGGIAMDHGSHAFYLAFDWMDAYPLAIGASVSTIDPSWDTEDNLSCTMRFPNGRMASAHLTWSGGMQRMLYTVHGSRGAIRVEDDDIEVIHKKQHGEGEVAWETEAACVASSWMDPSHRSWFESVLAELEIAILRRDLASTRIDDALRCIEVIDASYRSARNGGHEISLRGSEPLVRRRSRTSPLLR